MANKQHIEWLLEGVKAWNARRESEDQRLRGFRADFRGARLQRIFREHGRLVDERIPLAGAHLTHADFSASDLSQSDLRDADLRGANLRASDLTEADLTRAILASANLGEATLTNANLSEADLRGVDLSGAKFWDANLSETKLPDANVLTADLSGAEPWRAALFAEHRSSVQQCDVRSPSITTVNGLMDEYKRLRQYYDGNVRRPQIEIYLRGEPQCDWPLRPAAMRNDGLRHDEGAMLNELIARRPEEFNGLTSALGRWTLAQHHDLKTRLLDVTKNPLVALFFACEANPKYDARDGRLHVFAVPRLLVKPFNSDTVSIVTNFAKLYKREQDLLLGKQVSQAVFHELDRIFQSADEIRFGPNSTKKVREYPTAMNRLYQFIREEKPYFDDRIDIEDLFQVFVVEPQQTSERVRAQSAAFLVSAFHERFERDEIVKWNSKIPVYAHYTLRIPSVCKEDILSDLELLNINRETLYPGLDESARAITERYRRQR